MTPDFIYENAPLVEVIAEIHWDLVPVQSVPGGKLDPYASVVREEFAKFAEKRGLTNVETVVPLDVPAELLPHKPFVRFRPKPRPWPLYQLGPGLFTANIVPPYEGWAAFREFLSTGIHALMGAYPLPEKLMKISKVELRYIDAFTPRHGFTTYMDFIKRYLPVVCPLPQEFTSKHVRPDNDHSFRFEYSFVSGEDENFTGTIRLAPGASGNEKAAIMEFVVARKGSFGTVDPNKLQEWFDRGHALVRTWFDDLLSDPLRKKFGPKKLIEAD